MISATTASACSTAASAVATESPSRQKPCSSGGETWTNATSRGRVPSLKIEGISDRNTGVKSALPASMAARTFGPANSALCRKAPAHSSLA